MQITGLTFSYEKFLVFDDFNFESSEPIIAFKGPSGCGKTTLLKIISQNLTPEKKSVVQYSKSTYFVIQEDSLFPWLTGEENILKFLDTDKKKIQSQKLFPFVESFLFKKASEMSYGQRRMIELFRALIFKPDLLLLDEPFNFMDKKSRCVFTSEIISLLESRTKVILTSHYNEDISDLKPTVYYFNNSFPVRELSTEDNKL
ncbi:MAG: ATP-binding cassette domain-containing protein [Bacteroidetes bacterium]|nr:ATP-binding cassette domain-containing protein [Bacteroidota bacterium]